MDEAQQDAPSIRRTEQIDRLQRSIRNAIIDVAIGQYRKEEPSAPPIWWSTSGEHLSDSSTPSQ